MHQKEHSEQNLTQKCVDLRKLKAVGAAQFVMIWSMKANKTEHFEAILFVLEIYSNEILSYTHGPLLKFCNCEV